MEDSLVLAIVVIGCGEVLRLYHAILWVSDRQLDNMNFCIDLKEVVDYLKQGNNDIWIWKNCVWL